MLRLISFISIALLAALPLYAQSEETGEWSKLVNGVKGRLIAAYDHDFNGTKLIAIYLELKNGSRGWDIYYDVDRSIESRVIDADDNVVEKYDAPASIIPSLPPWLVLPFDSTFRFRISVSGYGVPKNAGTNVQMMDGNWLVKTGNGKKYFLKARFISKPKPDVPHHAWEGEMELPKVLIP
jgi:hypothetical protein